jgi:hypothetical protein
VGFVVDKMALEQIFFEFFGFPHQLSFDKMLHIRLSSGAGTINQLVTDVPSGLSTNPPNEIKKKILLLLPFPFSSRAYSCHIHSDSTRARHIRHSFPVKSTYGVEVAL